MIIRIYFIIFLCSIYISFFGQNSVYETSSFKFLNIATSSRQNYLGKAAIATFEPQIDIALANPALIQFHTRGKILASSAYYFTSLYGNVAYGLNNYKHDIPYVVGANFISYGEQIQTDVDGNVLGKFIPNEISTYIAASKTYKNYNFGTTIKFAYGNYLLASSAGVAMDLSMLYRDEEREVYATLLLKNIGHQFVGRNTQSATLPFDIQLALSKKLKHLPFRLTIMAQEIHNWTSINNSSDYYLFPLDPFVTVKDNDLLTILMSKFVFSGEFTLGKAFRFGASYDVKKSIEGRFDAFRGLQGLALGFGIYTRKYDFGYSYSRLTPISVNHQFTLGINLREIKTK